MQQISLCMIVKNEEEVLDQCLSSVSDLCEEIIIVDTGSTDRTKDIARKYTNHIFDFVWIDDFSAARNYAFKQATKDFIFWLDADDVLLAKDQAKLAALKQELHEQTDAVSMLYHISFDEYDNPTFSFRRNRLVKRVNGFQWISPVHEFLDVRGNIVYSDIAVTHRKHKKSKTTAEPGRNLRIYERRLEKEEPFSPRDLFYYANELKDHKQYTNAITYYNKFLDTNQGWIEDIIRAHIYLSDCYRALNCKEEELRILTASLCYDIPRPEAACLIGDIFMKQNSMQKAVFWYETALTVEKVDTGGFENKSFSTWYPHMQLCVCYWRLGDLTKAKEHNQLAKSYRPHDEAIRRNEQFFASEGVMD